MTWKTVIEAVAEETHRAWIGAGLVIAAIAVLACTIRAAELRIARRKRRSALYAADIERERLAHAGREALGLNQLERILRDHQDAETLRAVLNEEADRQMLNGRRPGSYADDAHDMFPQERD